MGTRRKWLPAPHGALMFKNLVLLSRLGHWTETGRPDGAASGLTPRP